MKQIIVGLTILILSTCLHSVVYQWNDTGFQYLMSHSSNNGEVSDKSSREDGSEGGTSSCTFVHAVDVSINKFLSAFFQTDLNWEDRNPKNLMTSASQPASFYKNWRVSGAYNRFQAKMEYLNDKQYGKIQYRNQYFAPGKTNRSYVFVVNPNLPWDAKESLAHTPTFIHDIYTQMKWETSQGSFEIGERVRISEYDLAMWDDLGARHQIPTQRDENFFNAQAKINTVPYLFLLANAYSKHDNTDDYFDLTHYGFGVAFDRRFDFFHMLDASVQYDRMKSDKYSKDPISKDERENYVTSQLRYTHRVGNNLTAFVSYINRSVYSKDQESMLLISNMVRLQARYSFANDLNGDSYIIIGGKLSQENKTSLVFGEFNYPVIPKLYVNMTDKYSPTYLYDNAGVKETAHENEVSVGLNFYFTPWQLVYVSDTFSLIGKKGLVPSSQQLISFGTKLVF